MADETQRARRATTAVFVVTGTVFAAWASRIPAVQDRLGVGAADLALAFLALNAGAVAGLPAGGALTTRAGSRRVLAGGLLAFPAGLVCVGLAPTFGWLLAALAAMAAANSVVDVAMNAQGVEVERRMRRPVLSSLHAGHSAGVLAGGALGTAAAAAGIAPREHFAIVAALAAAAGIAAPRAVIDERGAPRATSARAPGRGRAVLLLGTVAFLAFLVEGAANDWSAVHLRTERGAGQALAAAGFTGFSLALVAGRLLGDRLTTARGRRRLVTVAAAVAGGGMAVVVAVPSLPAALAGWAVVGLGVAVVAPTVLGAAPAAARGGGVAGAVATVSACGYLGSFAGPPAIGALASASSLGAALALPAAAALGAALLARVALPA